LVICLKTFGLIAIAISPGGKRFFSHGKKS